MNKMVHDSSETVNLEGEGVNDLVMAPLDALLDAVRALDEALGLKKANLTRVLNLLEANELIERHGLGRENRLRLGRAAPPVEAGAAAAEPTAATPTPVARGLTYLSAVADAA